MSSTATRAATRPGPSRGLQAVIWVAFALALVLGVATSGLLRAGEAPSYTVASDITALSATSGVQQGAAPSGVGNVRVMVPAADLSVTYKDDPKELLPAWRWHSATQMRTPDMPTGDWDSSVFNGLANIGFSLSSLVWKLLLMLTQLAFSFDMLTPVLGQIDRVFVASADALGAAGLPVMAVIAAVVLAAKNMLKGRGGKTVGILLSAALVVGSLSYVTSMASSSVKGGTISAGSVKGSPSWLALKGSTFVNDTVGTLVTSFGKTARSVDPTQLNSAANYPTCADYVGELYRLYAKAQGAKKGGTSSLEQSAMTLVSYMWERSAMDVYTAAQFGESRYGTLMSCHMLELEADTPWKEQFAVVGGNPEGAASSRGKLKGYSGIAAGPFGKFTQHHESDHRATQSAILAWAACKGTLVRAGWHQSGDDAFKMQNEYCQNWFTWTPHDIVKGNSLITGDKSGISSSDGYNDALQWGDLDKIKASFASAEVKGETKEEQVEAMKAVLGLYGENAFQRLAYGFVSLLSAIAVGVMILVPAAGSIFGQVLLVAMLLVLPYTLVAVAFPNKDGGRAKMGTTLMRMTGLAFFIRTVFLLILGMSVHLAGIFYNLLSGGYLSTGTGGAKPKCFGKYDCLAAGPDPLAAGDVTLAADAGMGGALWSMIVPVAVVIVMRMLMKAVGLSNLMSVTGAVGFATKSAAKGVMGGGKDGKGAFGRMNASMAGTMKTRKDAMDKLRGLKDPSSRLGQAGRAAGRYGRDAFKHQALTRRGQLAKAISNGLIDEDQANAIYAGKKTMDQAIAEKKQNQVLGERQRTLADHNAKAARGQGTPITGALADSYLSGKMSLHQAEKLAQVHARAFPQASPGPDALQEALAEGQEAAGAAAVDGAADPVLGWDNFGSLDRRGLLDPSGAAGMVTSPVTKHALGTGNPADHDQLTHQLQLERRNLQLRNVGQDEEGYVADMKGYVADQFEATRIAAQGVAFPRELTAAEVSVSRSQAAAAAGVPEDFIVMSDTGLGAVISPLARNDQGVHIVPDGLDEQVAKKLIANPANYVVGLERKQGESEAEWHTRVVLSCQAAGAMDSDGNWSSVVAEKIAEAVEQGAKTPQEISVKLQDLKLEVPHFQKLAIDEFIAEHKPQARADVRVQVHAEEHAAQVQQLSQQAIARAEQVWQSALAPLLTRARDAANTPEFDDQLEALSAALTKEMTSVLSDLGSVAGEAALTSRALEEPGIDVTKVARSLQGSGKADLAGLQAEVDRRIAELKQAPPEFRYDLMSDLRQYAEASLASYKEKMAEAVDHLGRTLEEEKMAAHQRLRAQVQRARRGSDFAATRDDLTAALPATGRGA